ncbi:unnamed protein product [Nippostrongylus brasiliensis]|uniref:Copper transport protein n=1 Tax=Nippostrongylus brasiliensis TaxID=27835 RepID=A0A0N4XGL8_NIPBR|nr:unnamed protein product [Nippostrongylus brasiliensis]
MSSSQSPLADSADNISQDTIPFAPILQITGLTKRVFSGFRLAQAALYGVQAMLAYVLMLIVMTFNGNLILSIVVGEALYVYMSFYMLYTFNVANVVVHSSQKVYVVFRYV